MCITCEREVKGEKSTAFAEWPKREKETVTARGGDDIDRCEGTESEMNDEEFREARKFSPRRVSTDEALVGAHVAFSDRL